MEKSIIYFLCTGNSCRSQMAEGFGHHYLGDRYEVYSAGIEAHGVNPKAVKAMNEIGIDISNQTSDTIDRDILSKADLVVTLCGHANDVCPATLQTKSGNTGDSMTLQRRRGQMKNSGSSSSVSVMKSVQELRGLPRRGSNKRSDLNGNYSNIRSCDVL